MLKLTDNGIKCLQKCKEENLALRICSLKLYGTETYECKNMRIIKKYGDKILEADFITPYYVKKDSYFDRMTIFVCTKNYSNYCYLVDHKFETKNPLVDDAGALLSYRITITLEESDYLEILVD